MKREFRENFEIKASKKITDTDNLERYPEVD